jgi:hypothetical protein
MPDILNIAQISIYTHGGNITFEITLMGNSNKISKGM